MSSLRKAMATKKPNSNSKRVYQVWKGDNKFVCYGRLIFGPDMASLLISILLIGAPAIAFFVQVFRKIHGYDKFHSQVGSEDQSNILGIPVLVVGVTVLLLDLIFLFLTSSRDPGIIPRNKRPPEFDEVFDLNTPSMEWINGRTPQLRLPRAKDVIVDGFVVKVKYCDTCLLYRPPRASHCSVCNNCVQKFDHHCPWVDQCIGLRNYRSFFLFISTSTFLCIYVFIFSLLNILKEKKHHQNSLWKSMTGEIISLVLIAYTFVAVWFVGGLTAFHLFLISKNQTTYENFRHRYEKKDNPYNKGILRNFKEVFFSRIPPSMNNFRSWEIEEATGIVSLTPSCAMSSKEKVDVEMGNNHQLDSTMDITSIFQTLDYGTIDCNNLEEKDRSLNDANDPLFNVRNIEEKGELSDNGIDDIVVVGERSQEKEDTTFLIAMTEEENRARGTLASADHDNHFSRT